MPHCYARTILYLLLTLPFLLVAQDTVIYHLVLKKDVAYTTAGLVGIGAAEMIRKQTPAITKMALPELDLPDIDEIIFDYRPSQAGTWSDRTMYASVGINALFLLHKKSRNDFGTISVLLAETMVINGGLTNLSKTIFRRPRPYVYNPSWSSDRLITNTDRTSMVSGHTSGAAAGTFFFARVFSDYYPNSKIKPYVWGLAATLPALTGYLRIRADKHYPSDVIAGYFLGAAIGYLVPTLHKKPLFRGKLKINASQNDLSLGLRF